MHGNRDRQATPAPPAEDERKALEARRSDLLARATIGQLQGIHAQIREGNVERFALWKAAEDAGVEGRLEYPPTLEELRAQVEWLESQLAA
jgi:hypothetical protein